MFALSFPAKTDIDNKMMKEKIIKLWLSSGNNQVYNSGSTQKICDSLIRLTA